MSYRTAAENAAMAGSKSLSSQHIRDVEHGKTMAPELSRVPARRFFGEHMACQVLALHMWHENEEASGAPTLLGYQVPFFQRASDRWTQEQQVSFIESMYMGANVGAYMVNIPNHGHESMHNVLLDGLQRMTALKAYFKGDFGVRGEDGVERFWSDLGNDQAHLLRINFPWVMTRYTTVADMIDAYDRHNFGGTPHSEEDKARLSEHRRREEGKLSAGSPRA